METWQIVSGGVVRNHAATDHVAYCDAEHGELLCVFCADAGYGAGVRNLPPVHVGELVASDHPDPSSWLCYECGNNVLTYL